MPGSGGGGAYVRMNEADDLPARPKARPKLTHAPSRANFMRDLANSAILHDSPRSLNESGSSSSVTHKLLGTSVTLQYAEQHTLVWAQPLKTSTATVPAAELNLYMFPQIKSSGTEYFIEDEEELMLLTQMMLELAGKGSSHGPDPMLVSDSSGAFLLHGLLIANTDAAVSLVLRLLKQRPELLTQAHGPGPFYGENLLHVLAVNQREAEAIELLELAAAALDDAPLRSFLASMARGEFFTLEPMCWYGGSPVAYLCSFRAIAVLQHLYATPRLRALVGPDDERLRCPISGYLPIHAAVANSRMEAFDFLVSQGASTRALTVPTAGPGPQAELELTPLQLACRIGNQVMVEHLVQQRWQVQWKWGPVISYKLPLDEIDSIGESKFDLMELIVMPDAVPATQQMLLDDFMGGFLFKLFEQKWELFGRRQHRLFRLLDAASLSMLLVVAFWLKLDPVGCDRYLIPLGAICALSLQIFYELLKLGCNVKRSSRMNSTPVTKLLTHSISGVACLSVLVGTTHEPDEAGRGDEAAWALLSVAIFAEFIAFISVVFMEFRNLGVFAIVVERLLVHDVRIFLSYFLLYLLCFWASLFVNYPRAGSGILELVPEFNGVFSSFMAVVNLGLTGAKFNINTLDAEALDLNPGELANLFLFAGFYYCTCAAPEWRRHARELLEMRACKAAACFLRESRSSLA